MSFLQLTQAPDVLPILDDDIADQSPFFLLRLFKDDVLKDQFAKIKGEGLNEYYFMIDKEVDYNSLRIDIYSSEPEKALLENNNYHLGNQQFNIESIEFFEVENGPNNKFEIEPTSEDDYLTFIARDNANNLTIETINTFKTTPTIPDPELTYVEFTVKKDWVNESEESVKLFLLADGKMIREVTLSDDNDWIHTFKGLPKFNEDGDEVLYEIEEIELDGYETIYEKIKNDFILIISELVNKKEPPVINVIGDNPLTLDVGEEFNDPGATAKSSNGEDLTEFIKTTSNVNPNAIGEYEVTYTITDTSGLTSSANRTVIIKEKDESDNEVNKQEPKDKEVKKVAEFEDNKKHVSELTEPEQNIGEENKQHKVPSTATNFYNLMLIGLSLILAPFLFKKRLFSKQKTR